VSYNDTTVVAENGDGRPAVWFGTGIVVVVCYQQLGVDERGYLCCWR
jgi:hypothetical protein